MASASAVPRHDEDVLLRVEHLVVEHRLGGGRTVHAVSDVSFELRAGETLGLVGESGCGKTTIGRAIVAHPPPTSGRVWFDGEELTALDQRALRRARSKLHVIFQDPRSSLNPRRKVGDIVNEGPTIQRWPADGGETVDEMLEVVGLDPERARNRRPHEFSGGECQRIAIARALMLKPKLLICDEAVSALDVSVRAQILNLLEDTKARYELTILFIAHDLAVVKNISDRVAVMYLGKLCEIAPADALYETPAHPYTQALLEAVPLADPDAPVGKPVISGELPSPLDPPSGCRFRTRCPLAMRRCAVEDPEMREIAPGHSVACHAVSPVQ